jgi:endonuclease VIII
VPEGDTIHRIARRMQSALGEREMVLADAPSPRSPIHGRARDLKGRVLERAEARGKHLLIHFSGDLAVHSHLGMNGRWRIAADGRAPFGKPWLVLSSGRGIAAQTGGQVLRLVSEARLRNDPALRRLGPDPLAPGFELATTASRMRSAAAAIEIGEALLDQTLVAGIGNSIRNGALWHARVNPWRRVGEVEPEELERVLAESRRIMRITLEKGKRPPSIYRAERRGCPRCGGRVSVRGQGDANRAAYWCERCQPG